jgi:DNA-directed RNA polymerase specialized sigma24 family protein
MVVCLNEIFDQANLTALAILCPDELKQFKRREPTEGRYCLALLRIALIEQPNEAWAILQHCFSDIVRSWVRNHPHAGIALSRDSEENYVAQTFSRFWFAMQKHQIKFASLQSVLGYLHATLNSILIDTMRLYLHSRIVPLPETDILKEPTEEERSYGQELWESIQSLLSNAREQRIVYLLYYCGLKPREIILRCPGEFASVKEIYRLNKNVIERLQRNRERLWWLLGLGEGAVS